MQKWKKLGLIYAPDGKLSWMKTHAMMPCVVPYDDNYVQVYFSPRDSDNRSRPASLLVNPVTLDVKELTHKPMLELGAQGSFDDAGVMPTCVYDVGDDTYMAFNGWSLGKSVPFYSFNGLALKDKSNFFRKVSVYPSLLNRSESDPYSTFAPFILNADGEWFMWYVSLVKWEVDKHYYHIKVAVSDNGIDWNPCNKICIDFLGSAEYAIARPVVIYENGIFKMWFSSRASNDVATYRIKYAESSNGFDWIRKDNEVALDVSITGWDSEMICYGYVFDHNEVRYMAYNGNGYGKTGFGLAVLESE